MAPLCKRCETRHYGTELVLCNRAYAASKKIEPAISVPVVVHTGSSRDVGSSRHGVYKDAEARKAYRREWMKKHRKTTQ